MDEFDTAALLSLKSTLAILFQDDVGPSLLLVSESPFRYIM
jgi:hypothetical protein